MALLISNFAQSSLTVALGSNSSTDTVITVADGSRFPNPSTGDWFPIVLISADTLTHEVVWGTSRSGNTITVSRAQEGSSASAFAVGAIVSHNLTKEAYEQFVRQGADNLTVKRGLNYGLAAGTVTTMTATIANIAAYSDKLTVNVQAVGDNTSNFVTLNVNGLGAARVRYSEADGALEPGAIKANVTYSLTYAASVGGWILNNPSTTAATTLKAGIAQLAGTSEETFDVDGDNTKAVTQQSASRIAKANSDALITSVFPNNVTYTGDGRDGSVLVPTSTPLEVNSFTINEYDALNIPAGSVLTTENTIGVAILRVKGAFTQSGRIIGCRSGSYWPTRHMGPTGGTHSTKTISTSKFAFAGQSDLYGFSNSVRARANYISAQHLEVALRAGIPLTSLHGGAGAAYFDAGDTQNGFNTVPEQGGGGLIIIADTIVIGATAQTEKFHAVPETEYPSGEAKTGPSAGGLILYVARSVTIDPAASYEMGVEGIGQNSAFWNTENLAANEQVAGAASGQCFILNTSDNSVTRVF